MRLRIPLPALESWLRIGALLACSLLGAGELPAQGSVRSFQKLSHSSGGPFRPRLADSDQFGRSVACLGDIDGDGVPDLAVGAHADDDGGTLSGDSDVGAVWILRMRADGTVKAAQKISAESGGLGAVLEDGDEFGRSVAALGDWDGDGVPDIAVGANKDDDGGPDFGAVYLLMLAADGSVKEHAKISATTGGFTGELELADEFGRGLSLLGDMDADGVNEIAVCATNDDDGGTNRGAVYILFMSLDGTVKAHQKISNTSGNFTAGLTDFDSFGMSIDNLGDFDGDGLEDLIVGSIGDDNGGSQTGAVYLLRLNADGTVKAHSKINHSNGGIFGLLDAVDQFGFSVASLGDIDADGVTDIAVGAILDDDGGQANDANHGCAWILMLNPDGSVKTYRKISATQGNLPEQLDQGDWFGSSMAGLGDFDLDGIPDLAVGSRFDDDGGNARGACYLLWLDDTPPDPPVCDFGIAGHEDGEVASGPAPFTVQFEDRSTGSLGRWSWSFGDGQIYNFQHPIYVYDTPGTYTVLLSVRGPAGQDALLSRDRIVVTDPVADFSAVLTSGVAPVGIPFTNESSSLFTTFTWSFGDGRNSTQANPIHVYRLPGLYTVSLTASNDTYTDTVTKTSFIRIHEFPPPLASFTCAPESGDAPLPVVFSNSSTGLIDSYLWDFGDGTTSTEVAPLHTYSLPGTYTVSLSATGPEGTDVLSLVDFVRAATPPAPVAAFSAQPESGIAPLVVQFTDTSTGHVSAWNWDFGDGTSSFDPSPQHAYDLPGRYTVSLGVTGLGGSDSSLRTELVDVGEPPPVASFAYEPAAGEAPLQVAFTGMSQGNIVSWLWDFGDGEQSTLESPEHTYTAGGTYGVSLSVTSAGGTDELTIIEAIRVVDPPPPGIFDGGFEAQDPEAPPGLPWTSPGGDEHVVNPAVPAPEFRPEGGGDGNYGGGGPIEIDPDPIPADQGFPSDGRRWCELSAAGTTDALPPSSTSGPGQPGAGVGIAQTFRHPDGHTLLRFEAAFLLNGAAQDAARNDWMAVELSDGAETQVVWLRDGFSSFPLTSEKYGLPMTAPETVTVDLAALFPESTTRTDFTVSVKLGNGGDGEAPSRGYVDGFRLEPAGASALGCELNPARSLSVLAGAPRVGESLTLGIDNPLGTQTPGALPILVVSLDADSSGPCGRAIPGWSMLGPARDGRLLLDLLPPNPVLILAGAPWRGAGQPSAVELDVPNLAGLVGVEVHVQGVLVDPQARAEVRFGLTRAMTLLLSR